jgi:hypothetical protein
MKFGTLEYELSTKREKNDSKRQRKKNSNRQQQAVNEQTKLPTEKESVLSNESLIGPTLPLDWKKEIDETKNEIDSKLKRIAVIVF